MSANSLKPGTRITAPAGWICDCCSIVVADGYANMRCSEDTTHNVDGCCLLGQLASYYVLAGRPTKLEIPRPLISRRPAVLHCMHAMLSCMYGLQLYKQRATPTSKAAMRAYRPAANECPILQHISANK
jgi:hypothetical protein